MKQRKENWNAISQKDLKNCIGYENGGHFHNFPNNQLNFFLKFDIFTNRKAKEGIIHKINIEFSILDEKYRKIDVHLTIG